jgi:hypothetical protein
LPVKPSPLNTAGTLQIRLEDECDKTPAFVLAAALLLSGCAALAQRFQRRVQLRRVAS